MTRPQSQIGDDEARRLWQRALELQDEAERSVSSLASQSGETRLSLEHVAEAAEGAGIHPDFVLMARAEEQLPDAAEIRRQNWRVRWLRGTVSNATTGSVEHAVAASRPAWMRPSHGEVVVFNAVEE